MIVLPPGNILQNIFLKSRIKKNKWKSFLEIGSGNGYVSNLFLKNNLKGLGCDLNEGACINNKELNQKFIDKGSYKVENIDFFKIDNEEKFDIIISCMVIEHLEDDILESFIKKCNSLLNPSGSIVLFVPSSMKYWGIEDEIAGHIKRYEFDDFKVLSKKHSLEIDELSGLTYPLSNWLFGLSNFLIKRNESNVLELNQKEKTVYTGNRNVSFKTTFPSVFGLILNEIVLWPFHLLQILNKNNPNSLVMYAHLKKT